MITNSVLGKSWRCRECKKGYCRFGQGLGLNRGFLVAIEFMVLCHDRGFLRRDRGSMCRDMVLRLQAVSWSRHSFSMSRQSFASLS